MTTVSVPGRVSFGGDHSKLFGGPTIAGAIDLRVHVTVADRPDDRVAIEGPLVSTSTTLANVFDGGEVDDSLIVSKADRDLAVYPLLRTVLSDLGVDDPADISGFDVEISVDPDFELGVGLASSTGLITALAAGLHDHFGDRLPHDELAETVTTIEADLYDDASPIDPRAIVRGGFVYRDADGDRSHVDRSMPIVLGVGQPKTTREAVTDHVADLETELGPLFESVHGLADDVTAELWTSLQAPDPARTRRLLTFYGTLIETLGMASWPIPQARATAVARDVDAGVKQSDFGHRATLLGVPVDEEDAETLERAFAGSMDPIVTRVAETGIRYHDGP
jgi:mevalonate kinase